MARSRFYYKTESLGSYTGRIADGTPRVARQIVIRAEQRMQYHIKRRTPKDTGKLRMSIMTEHDRWEMVGASIVRNPHSRRGKSMRMLEGGVYTNVEYAPYVEYDTGRYGPNPGGEGGGRYAIVPRRSKVLVFVIDGRTIFTRKVRHPGSKGKHMFSRGAAFVGREGYIHNQSRDILAAWRARGMVVRPNSGFVREPFKKVRPSRIPESSFNDLGKRDP